MDYSLMVAVDEVFTSLILVLDTANVKQSRKELVVGIIDVVRTYTWVRTIFLPARAVFKIHLTLHRTRNWNHGSKVSNHSKKKGVGFSIDNVQIVASLAAAEIGQLSPHQRYCDPVLKPSLKVLIQILGVQEPFPRSDESLHSSRYVTAQVSFLVFY